MLLRLMYVFEFLKAPMQRKYMWKLPDASTLRVSCLRLVTATLVQVGDDVRMRVKLVDESTAAVTLSGT